ncbi:hypothetical protein [Bacteroides acidifaciens]|uniref:hypothetical protein n=1 Tax=Bacteroides acidifaciens TaxID=85831 RepID=UPI0025928C6F|nr:hypothetical protein [uncultured Bacteroides sp.]
MNKIAILAVAYNRVDSITRLLKSLEKANYGDEKPTLIISIDKSKTDAVEKFADGYHWPHGEKIVRKHDKNMGLRNHMMSLGEWFDRFETIVVLEDDIVVSPCFYFFVRQSSDKYMGSQEVCGISLYSFARNYQTRLPFTPVSSEYDGYFMNCAMSWGEVWMKPQWMEFYNWYMRNQDFPIEPHLPELICKWEKSWLKYHTKYCIETNRYFLYPYVSLSSNNGDIGVHVGKGNSWGFQVPLQQGNKRIFILPDNISEAVCYDGFFENKAIYNALNLKEEECCIDLYGTQCNRLRKKYWLTLAHANFPVIKSFALSYRPLELSILEGEAGNAIFLYDTSCKEYKTSINKFLVLFLYNMEEISMIVHQYGWKDFIKDAIRLLIRR